MKKIIILSTLALTVIFAFKYKDSATEILPNNIVVNGKLFTSIFQQQAAEYKALCIQSYNLARLQLDQELKKTTIRPRAIITDIDETILDNSSFAIHEALLGKTYSPDAWHEWTNRSECDTLSGSVSFLKYASAKGIVVYYISNRDDQERAGTLANLKKFDFPYSDDAHLLLKETGSSKESRRQKVAAKYDIVVLLGDNLADFCADFDKKSTTERLEATLKLSKEFGKKFIVLPNANYGDWESALFKYDYKLSSAQKDSVIKGALKHY